MYEFILAAGLVGVWHALQSNIGLNLSDEGYLWNGVLRIGQGKIPIRDYKSYDPGRYYWTYAWTHVFGSGIMGIRRATAVFQLIGVWLGLLAASRMVADPFSLVLVGVAMVWWMQPRHKQFDHVVAIAAVYAAVRVIETPTLPVLFAAGVVVGFAGFMGRNHAVYSFCALFCVILAVAIDIVSPQPLQWLAAWLGGVALGYSPMLAMWLFIPSMFRRYFSDKVSAVLRRGTANMPLPVPWPWRPSLTQKGWRGRVSEFFLGIHFVLLPLYYGAAVWWLLTHRPLSDHPLVLASTAVGVFYLHHAFSRPDAGHLCQSIQPFLLAAYPIALSQENRILQAGGVTALGIAAFFGARPISPLMGWLEDRSGYVTYDLNGDRLRLPRPLANLLRTLQEFVSANIAPEETIFIAPLLTTLYPVLKKKTPVRSDYMLFPESETAQHEIVGDLEKNLVNWALIQDAPQDGRDELRFRNTHALVWSYIEAQFEPLSIKGIGSTRQMYRRTRPLSELGAPDPLVAALH